MRILLLNWRDLGHPAGGGAERYVHEVARRWVAGGHEVTLFCARFPGASSVGERDGVRILRAGGRWSVYRKAGAFLSATPSTWDAVVESVNTKPFFARRYGAPALAIVHQLAKEVWFHETPLPVALLGRFVLEPWWIRRLRETPVVAVSESTRRDLERAGISPVAVAPPGTPVPPLGPWPKELVPTLLYMGRLKRSKRPDAAFAAWQRVRRFVPETRLWVVGDGPLRPALERQAGGGMTVFGRVDEARKWELLARAHLLLAPSVREGWGIVVMEAAAVGTPAVGYRVPGLIDSIRDGETGWLCQPDPRAMASAALRALANPDMRVVGARAREWSRKFTWDAVADAILDRVTNVAVSG